MADIFLLANDNDCTKTLTDKFPRIKIIKTNNKELTTDILNIILKKTLSKFFYVINDSNIDIVNFNFEYTPETWEEKYIHVWDNSKTVRLLSRKHVKLDPVKYTDEYYNTGLAELKVHRNSITKSVTNVFASSDMFVIVENMHCAEYFLERHPYATAIISKGITKDALLEMVYACKTEYFYVIVNPLIDLNFDFKFKPVTKEAYTYNSKSINIWNNDYTIRMFCKRYVLVNIDNYTDAALKERKADIINNVTTDFLYTTVDLDIIFISYYEEYADENYAKLKKRFPRAKRVDGVVGILEAHRQAAKLSTTPMFYVVDSDAIIKQSFNFSYVPPLWDMEYVHIWRSENPVNGLKYGYGGVKLFPTYAIREAKDWNIDFTTSTSKGIKVFDAVSNITAFNTSPFETWKSAFRECVKLASKVIANQVDKDTEERLSAWCSNEYNTPFAEYSARGAREGRDYGSKFKHDKEKLNNINNFKWLKEYYDSNIT